MLVVLRVSGNSFNTRVRSENIYLIFPTPVSVYNYTAIESAYLHQRMWSYSQLNNIINYISTVL
jgi:hypothetical protein